MWATQHKGMLENSGPSWEWRPPIRVREDGQGPQPRWLSSPLEFDDGLWRHRNTVLRDYVPGKGKAVADALSIFAVTIGKEEPTPSGNDVVICGANSEEREWPKEQTGQEFQTVD